MINISDNDTTRLCASAKLILDTPQLRYITIFQCIVGLLILFPNIFTLTLIWRVRVFHANLRLILAHLTASLLVFSVSILVKALYRLTGDACSFPVPLRRCIIQDWTMAIPAVTSVMSLIGLSLERLYATLRYRTYDCSGSVPYLGMFLVGLAWTVSLLQTIPNYFHAPANAWIPICESALVIKPEAMANIAVINIIFEAVATLLTITVYGYNQYLLNHTAINKAKYSLSARFQIIQNVQLNKVLMPGMILHISCYLSSYALMSSVFIGDRGFSAAQKMWFVHLTFLWRMLYALLDPLLFMALNQSIRDAVKKTMVGKIIYGIIDRSGLKKENVGPIQVHAANRRTHFQYLEDAWARPKRRML